MRTTVAAAIAVGLLTTGCSTGPTPRLAALDQATSNGPSVKPTHIGTIDDAPVYAPRGTPDQPWCIRIVRDTTEATTCTTEEGFTRRGVTLRVDTDDGDRVAVTLLPDDFTGQLGDGFKIVGPNLAAPSESDCPACGPPMLASSTTPPLGPGSARA